MNNNLKKFVVPYVDQDIDFWERMHSKYNDYIKEVYFPWPDEETGTGRPKQPDRFLLKFLESKILPVSLLINPIVLPYPVNEIKDKLIEKIAYYLKYYRLVGITVANPELASTIKKTFPELEITASVLMNIYNEQQLLMLENNFDSLVPSHSIIRSISSLETIRKKFSAKIRIIVNEGCLTSCVFRTQHFYEMSNLKILYPNSLCNNILRKKPWLRLTGDWILPQHIYLFDGIYDELKLSGRISLQNSERYFNVLESYIFSKPLYPHEIGGGPAAVNVLMNITSEFYKYTLTCKKNCLTCSVCEEYWNNNIGKL
jgi:collagenase-like PrtC family protease